MLTGSVRFTSRKAIRESLTGRIVTHELLPLTLSEIVGRPLNTLSLQIIESNSLESLIVKIGKNSKVFSSTAESKLYETHGGFPGVCFVRDEQIRKLRIQEYLKTILDRDVREVYPTTLPYSQILEFVLTLASQQDEPIDFSKLQKITEISTPTQKKY